MFFYARAQRFILFETNVKIRIEIKKIDSIRYN